MPVFLLLRADFFRNVQISEKSLRLVVHDKFLGEIRLSKQRKGIFVVGDVKTDMGIAAEYNRHPVCFAELQYLCVVCLG